MSWFSDLTGLLSDDHQTVWDAFDADGPALVGRADGRRLHFGTLSLPSLAELRGQTAGRIQAGDALRAQQIVADAAELHRDPANAGALFQVASQFNLLEMTSPDVAPEDGIARYAYDHTQGPACAMACGAGTLYRNYFVQMGAHRGQLIYRQLDMAADLERGLGAEGAFWRMQNGYLLPLSEDKLRQVSELLTPDMAGLIRIGVQSDTAVTGTDHRVAQAYCSAVPVSYSGLPAAVWEPLGRLVLHAAYEATLHAALRNAEATGSPIVYLTLLGGGAFGNPTDWILDAMRAALGKFALSGLDVRIVSYNQPNAAIDRMLGALR